MSQISIIGATLYGNRGAEAMLSAIVGQLRERAGSGTTFNVFSYYPERDRGLTEGHDLVFHSATPRFLATVLFPTAILLRLARLVRWSWLTHRLPSATQALAASDVLVCLAGVSFVDGRRKFLPFNVATIAPALVLGVPVVKVAQAMGPFHSIVNRLTARVFLGRCERIFTRGAWTDRHVRDLLGSLEKIQRADDVAFLFTPDYGLSRPGEGVDQALSAVIARRNRGQLVIGVCPSVVVAGKAHRSGWDYATRMQQLITALVHDGHSVVLYPNATRGSDMNSTHNNDLPLLHEILDGLPAEIRHEVIGCTGSINAAQVHELIGACDLHVVARFHAMVGALAQAVPVMVIGWSHKYLEVMELLGQEDLVLDYAHGDLEPMLATVRRLVDERAMRSMSIQHALPAVRQRSSAQIDFLAHLVGAPR